MNGNEQEIARWLAAEEGQFFERKSAWDRSGPQPKQRQAKDIAHDIAETLSAMANADGGELVVGMEDDGTVPQGSTRYAARVGQADTRAATQGTAN